MHTFLEFIAILAVIIGTAFSVLGVLGFIRMPDVYTRLHATGKVSVFGVVLLLLATVALTPLEFGKGLVLIVLLVIGGPVTSHAIGSAAPSTVRGEISGGAMSAGTRSGEREAFLVLFGEVRLAEVGHLAGRNEREQ